LWLTPASTPGLGRLVDPSGKFRCHDEPVARAHLESMTATTLPDGFYAVALREQDRIVIRKYRSLFPPPGIAPANMAGL